MMFSSDQIALLDNYQLYKLSKLKSINPVHLNQMKQALNDRVTTKYELSLLNEKLELELFTFNEYILNKKYHPIITGFLALFHFKRIALHRAIGKHSEAKTYAYKFLLGVIFYWYVYVFYFFTIRIIF